MEDVIWFAFGMLGAVAWSVLRRAMAEMAELDASEESWKSIMFLEENKGE